MCVRACVCIFSSRCPIGIQPYPVIYAVVNDPVRSLLDRKRAKEYLQSSNEIMKAKTRQKQQQQKETKKETKKTRYNKQDKGKKC